MYWQCCLQCLGMNSGQTLSTFCSMGESAAGTIVKLQWDPGAEALKKFAT